MEKWGTKKWLNLVRKKWLKSAKKCNFSCKKEGRKTFAISTIAPNAQNFGFFGHFLTIFWSIFGFSTFSTFFEKSCKKRDFLVKKVCSFFGFVLQVFSDFLQKMGYVKWPHFWSSKSGYFDHLGHLFGPDPKILWSGRFPKSSGFAVQNTKRKKRF